MQKEVLPLHKLQDHTYEYQNPFRLEEDNPSQRYCQNQLSHLSLSHIDPDCLIQGKNHIQQNQNKDLEYW